MSQITTDLRHALDVAAAWLNGGDAENTGRRVAEAREVMAALNVAVFALDRRIDEIENRTTIV